VTIIRLGLAAIVAAVVAMATPVSPAFAADYASLVLDADTGQVLEAIDADARHYPASLTKMMTLYLLFDALQRKEVTFATPLKVSARAGRQPPSKLAVQVGGTIAVKDAILALVTKSANDIAVTVAEGLDKSERDFALRMTAMAHKLGMKNTTFRNASGLFHRGQMTTARDMATLARALLRDFPQYYHFFSTPSFTYAGQTFQNHNGLLESYDGLDGIKTGYLAASGFNLVASASRSGHRLIGVVLGGKTAVTRNRQMAKLLDAGFGSLADGSAKIQEAKAPPSPSQGTKVAASVGKKGVKAPASHEKVVVAKPDAAVASTDTPPEDGVSTADGEWAVQVGAYRSRDPAYEAARLAVEKAPTILSEGVIKIVPLKTKRHILYRARIAGFERDQADSACHTLERKGMACLVVSMKGVQVAANP